MKECDRKRVFVIVLFIIGSHKEPSTGYSMKKADTCYSEQTQPRFYIVNPNRDTCSSVERMADGDQKQKVVHPSRRMEGHVPRSPSEGPFDETNLDVDEIEVKGTTGL